jgi:hypothetical protein
VLLKITGNTEFTQVCFLLFMEMRFQQVLQACFWFFTDRYLSCIHLCYPVDFRLDYTFWHDFTELVYIWTLSVHLLKQKATLQIFIQYVTLHDKYELKSYEHTNTVSTLTEETRHTKTTDCTWNVLMLKIHCNPIPIHTHTPYTWHFVCFCVRDREPNDRPKVMSNPTK